MSIKSQLTLISLFLLSFSFTANAALSATTAKTIEGTKPYLSTTHVTAINAGNDFSLLGVKFDSNSYFTGSDINAKLTLLGISLGGLTPTTLSQKLGNGSTGTTVAAYKTPTAVTDADDSDGDGFTATALTGSATTGWYYSNSGTETALAGTNLTTTFCALAAKGIAPYIKISGPVTLSTEYGAPNSQVYDIANAASPISGGTNNPVRRFYPSGGAMVCFASPNLSYASGNYNPNEPTKFDPTYGFLPQANAVDNFPRTGSNNLYFYLIVTGMNAGSATWSASTSDTSSVPIKATVAKNTVAPGVISSSWSYNANTMVLVTLSGPDKSSTGVGATAPVAYPNSTTNPKRVVNITITGTDGTNTVNYPFSIQTWYINRGSVSKPAKNYNGSTPDNQTDWCSGLNGTNYKIVGVADLTNAVGNGWTAGSSTGNYFQRRVTGGLFSEWGYIGTYTGSDWLTNTVYWTGDTGVNQFFVNCVMGPVISASASGDRFGACRSQ